jgi:membrane-associated phospholipid phosphatase
MGFVGFDMEHTSKRRRTAVTSTAVVLAVAVLAVACSSASEPAATTPVPPSSSEWSSPSSSEPGEHFDPAPLSTAGVTWVLVTPEQIPVPAPSPSADTTESPASEDDPAALVPWVRLTLDLVSQQGKNPPLAAREYALVSVAANDAAVAAAHWRDAYGHASYPSSRAAVAGAASRVLAFLFPETPADDLERRAAEAADAVVQSGTAGRSDVEAGLALGRAVAEQVIAHARSDGSEGHWAEKWDGVRPTGAEHWAPPPGVEGERAEPVEPRAASWKTWVVGTEELRPAPPPAYGSAEFLAEAREVMEVRRALTPEQDAIARRWAGGPGTPLPPGLWNQIALDEVAAAGLGLHDAAGLLAALNVAQADAAILAWACKYTYWSPRPVNAIRDLGLDPAWESVLPTPVFPSYVSGHATFSAASAEVLAAALPERAAAVRAMAREAAASRLYAGIHFRSDNEAGLELGAGIGRRVVERVERAATGSATGSAADVTDSGS